MSFEEQFDRIIRKKAEEAVFPFDESNWAKANAMLTAEKKVRQLTLLRKLQVPFLLLVFLGFSVCTYLLLESDQMVATRNPGATPGKSSRIMTANFGLAAATFNLRSDNAAPATKAAALSGHTSQQIKSADTGPRLSKIRQVNRNEFTSVEIRPLEEVMPGITPEALADAEGQDMPEMMSSIDFVKSSAVPVLEDPVLSVSSLRQADDDYVRKLCRLYMSAEAGSIFMKGWEASTTTDGRGWNYYAGINAGFYLNRSLSVGLGAQLFSLGNISQPFYQVSSKQYDFGYSTTHTMVTVNKLLYAAVPFNFNLHTSNGTRYSVGFTYSRPVDASSTVRTFRLLDNVQEQLQEQTSYGVYEGTSSQNLILTAGVSMPLANRVKLNAEGLLGLTDIFENNVGPNGKQTTTGIRVGLQIYFLNK